LTFALAEIEALHSQWPETLQCNIIIERAPLSLACGPDGDEPRYQAQVELDLGRRSPRVKAKVMHTDLYAALRAAFGDLRDTMPTYAGNDVTAAVAAA
jgi:ribosome-associated translation inhibitor RaiA